MLNCIKRYLLALFVLFPAVSLSQNVQEDKRDFNSRQLELWSFFNYSSGVDQPFWMHSQQFGRISTKGNQWIQEVYYREDFFEINSLKISGEGVFSGKVSNLESNVFFPLANVNVSFSGYRLRVGRYTDPVGLNNHNLSVGSLMVSQNATPIPKIGLDTPDYINIPGLNSVLQFKLMFSHGWFENERYVENPRLHQKYLYLKFNIGEVSAIGGVIHNVQWAGIEPDRGQLPDSFNDYLRVIFAQSADPNSNANLGEIINVIGNSVAAYDFGLLYRGEEFEASITRMFYLEDKVSTRFRSPWDGMWGVNVIMISSDLPVSAFTYEHINTKNQDAKSWELIGRRNYYGHYMYKNGWTYYDRPIGTPLILFDGEQITNNVLIAHNMGVTGQLGKMIDYKINLTYSRNYGIQDDWVDEPGESIPKDREDIIPIQEFRTDQFSWMVNLSYKFKTKSLLSINLKFAGDVGELYKENIGVMAGLRISLL